MSIVLGRRAWAELREPDRFVMKGIDIYRVTGGLLSEHWNVVDMLGLRRQLGL